MRPHPSLISVPDAKGYNHLHTHIIYECNIHTHIQKIWWTVTIESWLPHFLHTDAYAYTCITTPVNMNTCTHTRRTHRHTHTCGRKSYKDRRKQLLVKKDLDLYESQERRRWQMKILSELCQR